MLLKVSWRSLWRNKRRTLISVSAIALGLAIAVFFLSFGDGIYQQMINDAVRMQAGHFTIENPKYNDAPAVDLTVSGVSSLRAVLREMPGVASTKALVVGQGVLQSAAGSAGVSLIGVEPREEAKASPLAHHIVAGHYLQANDGRKVVIGKVLADRLKLGVGKKLVVSTNDASGQLVQELLHVEGIFSTGSPEIDGYVAQVPIGFARKLFGLKPDQATEVGVILHDPDARDSIMQQFKRKVHRADIAVLPWEEVMPDLVAYIRIDRGSDQVLQVIIIFLSLFTILNTVLMSVLERTHEFAVLLAVGTPPRFLRLQILVESALLGLLGVIVGLALGGGVAYWLQVRGLDLTKLMGSDLTVSGFALNPRMHALVRASVMEWLGGLVFVATLILSLIPMRRIKRISVADVLR